MTSESGSDRDEWQFGGGDIISERHESGPLIGRHLGTSEYLIERRLRQDPDGKRFYHVRKEEGGYHLYSAETVEGRYEVIPLSESEAFEENCVVETGTPQSGRGEQP